MKDYADQNNYVKPSNIQLGDTVLVKRPFNMIKGNTPYESTPLTVTGIKGTMITAESAGSRITRNSSFFKPIIPPSNISIRYDETEIGTPDDPEEDIIPMPAQGGNPHLDGGENATHPTTPHRDN